MELSEIKHLGELARISLTDEEAAALQKDITGILGYIAEIKNIEVTSKAEVKPELRNVMRRDAITCPPGTYTEKILAAATDTENSAIAVKKIL